MNSQGKITLLTVSILLPMMMPFVFYKNTTKIVIIDDDAIVDADDIDIVDDYKDVVKCKFQYNAEVL